MKAMLLTDLYDLKQNEKPLIIAEVPQPVPKDYEILIKVAACGVCHTELDEIEGRTPPPYYPVIPGHQVIGHVVEAGKQARLFSTGDRVGVAWIYSSCGHCQYCIGGRENLCADFRATGRDANGGYAEYMVVNENYAHAIPEGFSDVEAAPLLCAGAVGYRSLKLSNLANGQNLGLTGFGASGHLVLKMVRHKFPDVKIYVFARNKEETAFARSLGAAWAGDITDTPPELMHTIIDTTPVWQPVVRALQYLQPGGRLVINAIRKENHDKESLLNLDYPVHLWMEKEIKSVANVTRSDVREFLQLAAEMAIHPEVQVYPLDEANEALIELKNRKIRGAKVLKIS
ncbi:MAG: zinc-dependent alcohol dehydrogenase family protein [Bacteroidetes bacterium]|nr:zinc-dependent alcohol dehydrogenase family protein [Bacteroidota bacterium]